MPQYNRSCFSRDCVSREEVKNALRKIKKGKAVGPDELPPEVWKCMGEMEIKFLTRLFNKLLVGERMPKEWRRGVLNFQSIRTKATHSAMEATEV